MRVQFNNINQVIGYGEIFGEMTAEVDPIEGNYFDYDYINGQLVRMRWSDWHENTDFQIKFTTEDLLDMIEAVPQMANYTNSLTTYRDMMHRIFYVNFFNEGERELITYFGGIINEKD